MSIIRLSGTVIAKYRAEDCDSGPISGGNMKLFSLNKIGFAAILGFAVLLGASIDANAQGNSGWAHEKNRIRKEQKQYEKAQKRGYRLYRGGNYYETDQRGVDLIRQAINSGYRQGYQQGANDRRYRRGGSYGSTSGYRNGTYGYQSYVDRGQYQYYFRQGFQRGYQDGYNSQSRYGYNSGGTYNILGTILNNILNVRQY
jgi:hypothetical protein